MLQIGFDLPMRAWGFRVGLAALSCALTGVAVLSAAAPIVVQAEQGELGPGLSVATSRPGFGGTGYVTGFTKEGGQLTVRFDAPDAGVYALAVRYAAPSHKGYTMAVNGVGADGRFAPATTTFTDHDAGRVELVRGQNTLTLGNGWGFYEIDAFTLTAAAPYPPPRPVSARLADPQATPAARELMRQLVGEYGRVVRSGVITDDDRDAIRAIAGVRPAIMGGDLMDYSPSRVARGADAKGETQRLIAAARAGHTITLSWHWNAPADLNDADWYRGFYAASTRFDFATAIDDDRSPGHALLLRDIDAIAGQLKKMADAGVPVLWRPLHEADGGWFWWGTQGPDRFRRLWRLLYDRLTVTHGLHNLIWVWSSDGDVSWYPGDDVVDIVGLDAYPSRVNDPLAGRWWPLSRRFDGIKLLALTEFGGVPDIDRMQRLGIRWSYFVSWTRREGPSKTPVNDVKRVYQSAATFSLGVDATSRP